MIETKLQRSEATVRDPVCSMTLDPAQAFATRTLDEQTFYFCSERCVKQYDREHTGSATTGVSETERLQRIELAVADFDGRQGASRLEEHLRAMPGVRQAIANPKARLIRLVYNPAQVQLETLIEHARSMGYTLGTTAAQLAIEGMHCASCVVTIEEALKQTPGVLKGTVNPATQQAHVEYLPGLIDHKGLARSIEEAGYQVRGKAAPTETAIDRTEQDRARVYRTLIRKFWFAARHRLFLSTALPRAGRLAHAWQPCLAPRLGGAGAPHTASGGIREAST
jgi:P-type Cu+ transporter